jgi:hypothetical protein
MTSSISKGRHFSTKCCTVCLTEKTGRWYNDPRTDTATRCSICYRNGLSPIIKECTVCLRTSVGRWYKDYRNNTMTRCAECYAKIQPERCTDCLEKQPVNRKWYKDRKTGLMTRCSACYAKTHPLITKQCTVCLETKTARSAKWHRIAETIATTCCQVCYNRSREARTQKCSACLQLRTMKTWHRTPGTKILSLCHPCYEKSRKSKYFALSAPQKLPVGPIDKEPQQPVLPPLFPLLDELPFGRRPFLPEIDFSNNPSCNLLR